MRELVWIEERDALALHNRLLALDGGLPGVRDAGLLQSALARPRQLHAYGDKRTGFLVGVLFLELNGHDFTATEESAGQAILSLAAGTLDEPALAAWLRANAKRW